MNTSYWCFAEITANKASVLRLVDILTVLRKQERAKVKEIESTFDKYCKDDNLSWQARTLSRSMIS